MPKLSSINFFPSCPTVFESPTIGSERPIWMSLDDAMKAYWRTKAWHLNLTITSLGSEQNLDLTISGKNPTIEDNLDPEGGGGTYLEYAGPNANKATDLVCAPSHPSKENVFGQELFGPAWYLYYTANGGDIDILLGLSLSSLPFDFASLPSENKYTLNFWFTAYMNASYFDCFQDLVQSVDSAGEVGTFNINGIEHPIIGYNDDGDAESYGTSATISLTTEEEWDFS